MEIQITQCSPEQCKRKPSGSENLGFGRSFTDHFFLQNYTPERGWHRPRVEPYRTLSLDPATMVLHYGQQVFEGMKAYRGKDGVFLFRHRDNFRRLNRSCRRLVIPELNPEVLEQGLIALLRIDQDWIPHSSEGTLYIRPTVIATDPVLGVRPSDTYLFYAIAGPAGSYYAEGFNPVQIYVSDDYVRAVSGGIGEAKTAGNYAASLAAQQEAKKKGYAQVLWLDGQSRQFVEEVGTMNIFFRIQDELITSPLTGSILPGITRDSVIQIARSWGVKVVERMLSMDEVLEASSSGQLREVFGTGTAAVIAPINRFHFKGKEIQVGDGKTGELSAKLYHYILDLQYGRIEDPFGWRTQIL
ncbi:MAG: branched-chain amino acid aminotransferase [Myxococcota bacterium]